MVALMVLARQKEKSMLYINIIEYQFEILYYCFFVSLVHTFTNITFVIKYYIFLLNITIIKSFICCLYIAMVTIIC